MFTISNLLEWTLPFDFDTSFDTSFGEPARIISLWRKREENVDYILTQETWRKRSERQRFHLLQNSSSAKSLFDWLSSLGRIKLIYRVMCQVHSSKYYYHSATDELNVFYCSLQITKKIIFPIIYPLFEILHLRDNENANWNESNSKCILRRDSDAKTA